MCAHQMGVFLVRWLAGSSVYDDDDVHCSVSTALCTRRVAHGRHGRRLFLGGLRAAWLAQAAGSFLSSELS